jgi:hypothetical protein
LPDFLLDLLAFLPFVCWCLCDANALQFDVTAVGSTMCPHGLVAHLMDISTGERYIYACIMLYTLMVSTGLPAASCCASPGSKWSVLLG